MDEYNNPDVEIIEEEAETTEQGTASDGEQQTEETTAEESKALSLLGKVFNGVCKGVPPVSGSLQEYVNDYLRKYECEEWRDTQDEIFWIRRLKAIREMHRNTITKCATTGVVTGLGGAITLPVAIPADLAGTFYMQMRAVAATAIMAGYSYEELQADSIKTLLYAVMVGVSISQVAKKFGVNIGVHVAGVQLLKIPSKLLKQVSKQIGIKLTKSGLKAFVKAGKLVPFVGSVIGGAWNTIETKKICSRAWNELVASDPKFARLLSLIK